MGLRLYVDLPLHTGLDLDLPPGAARHAQVLRLQPGDALTLFNGQGGEHSATVTRMGRSAVAVQLTAHQAIERELACAVTLVVAMPANDRFDWLVEKATELGVAHIEPVHSERSVLRLSAERAEKKRDHWQGVATAAAEQCGRTRVPSIAPVRKLSQVVDLEATHADPLRLLLAWTDAQPLRERWADSQRANAVTAASRPCAVRLFSGPEGGFTDTEEQALRSIGALPTQLGARILRSETAPLAALSWIGLQAPN
ncbi:MAG: 16S rRNA (uracil(1498)-N(3))-methyltransferase [Leptothrix sp. (in: b-proteobacteria)]